LNPAWANSWRNPSSKKKKKKSQKGWGGEGGAGGVAQVIGPEFKPQYWKKKEIFTCSADRGILQAVHLPFPWIINLFEVGRGYFVPCEF
jgi:hypothetical protein